MNKELPRPYGYWRDFENVKRALIDVGKKVGHFPNQEDMKDAGYAGALNAIHRYHGGMLKVAKELGITSGRKENGYWTLENTLDECRRLVKKEGNLPSQLRMREFGLTSLEAAIAQHGGRFKIREMLGISEKSPERPKGHWTLNRVLEIYKNLTEQLGHPPTNSDLSRLDYNGMAWVIGNKYGGHKNIRSKLGIENPWRGGYWTEKRVIRVCKDLVKRNGDLPSMKELIELGKSEREFKGITSAISRFGGIRKIREVLQLKQRAVEDGFWTKEKTEKEVRRLVKEVGYLPTLNELAEMKRGDLIGAISRNYGMTKLRRTLRLEVGKVEAGYWTEEQVLRECRNVVEKYGDLIPNKQLNEKGHGALSAQIQRFGGFRHIRRRLGLEQNLKERDYWAVEENVLKEARKIMNEHDLDRFPTQKELSKWGYSMLGKAVYDYHGGFNTLRKKLGEKVIKLPNKTLKNWKSFREIVGNIINALGHFPTLKELKILNRMSVYSAAFTYHGGIGEVRKRMGYEVKPHITTETQLTTFLEKDAEAREISSLASVNENTVEIAEILAQRWPERFPSASQLARSLPGAVKRIGHSLHPFTMEKARGLCDKVKSLPAEIKYSLEEMIYAIAVDQYQTVFNQNPHGTLESLQDFAVEKSSISGLAKKVLKHYQSIYEFEIPGHGSLKEEA